MAKKVQIINHGRGFRGNENLRNGNEKIVLNDEQMAEVKKCASDFEYFAATYIYVVNLDLGESLFQLHKYAKRILRHIHTHRNSIFMAPRQQGKSTVVAAYLIWYALFKSSKTIAIVANKAAAAREVLSRVKYTFEHLPLWLQIAGIVTWNKGDIELSNGSKIFTAATTKDGIRGRSCDIIYWDECAHVEQNIAEDFYTSVYPTISSGKKTKMIVTSTPKGYNFFWKMWDEATKNTNGFYPLEIHYSEHPDRNEAWAIAQRKALGPVRYAAEVCNSFIGSSNTLISGDCLSHLSKAAVQPIFQNPDGLAVFAEPNLGKLDEYQKWIEAPHIYFGIVDVSRGVGGDYSTVTIIDVTELPYRVVARYRNNEVSGLLFPSVIYKLATEYNNAFVLVEINDNGQQIADILHDELEYENVLSVIMHSGAGQTLSNGFGRATNTRMGVRTTKTVKSVGCGVLKTLMEENKLIVQDEATIKEFSTFVEKKGSYAADIGYHDDLVMGLVLFGWLTSQLFFKDLTNMSMREKIFQARIDNIQDNFTPFIIKTDGNDYFRSKERDMYSMSSTNEHIPLNDSYENLLCLSDEDREMLIEILRK